MWSTISPNVANALVSVHACEPRRVRALAEVVLGALRDVLSERLL